MGGSSISVGPLASGMMACPDVISSQEMSHMNALQTAVSFELSLDALVLRDGSGQEVARFNRVG